MEPSFKPPKDEAEFKKRAESLTEAQAENMIKILMSRRDAAIKPFDAEIEFFKQIITYKKEGSV